MRRRQKSGPQTNPLAESAFEVSRRIERGWRKAVRQLPLSDGTWGYSRRGQPGDPVQGWKIHLSATPFSAEEVLARALPALRVRDALFKIPLRLAFLAELNSGLPEFSQVGKFLTVYPRSTAEAVALASALHAATLGLRGPEIPFEKRYRKTGIVYYRYGAFAADPTTIAGAGFIRDPKGNVHEDRRGPGCAVPSWLNDPFQPSRRRARLARGPIGQDYLAFKAIAQRGKGGVYEAVDLSVSPARLVIIKEGRRYGETDLAGRDGSARVKHEGRLLRVLREAGVPVPEVYAEFMQDGKRYLVLEKIAGRPLLSRNRTQPARPSSRRAQTILDQAGPLLSQIHAVGWVWRDCKPSHVFIHRDAIRLIDFEGACRTKDTQALPWSSANYVPPVYERSFARRAGTLEDDYALGVIAFQFLAGEFPPSNRGERAKIYHRTASPDALRTRIEALLQL